MLILITGGSCSGKSTFAKKLAGVLENSGRSCRVLTTDLFYHEPEEGLPLREVNFDSFEQMDLSEMHRVTFSLLNENQTIFSGFDFRTHQRSLELQSKRVDTVILEGLFALSLPELMDLCNLKIYIDVADSLRYERRLKYYSEVLKQDRELIDYKYFRQAEPFFQETIRKMKDKVDLLVPGARDNSPSLNMVMEMIEKNQD